MQEEVCELAGVKAPSAQQESGITRVCGRQFGASPPETPHDQRVQELQSQVLLYASASWQPHSTCCVPKHAVA